MASSRARAQSPAQAEREGVREIVSIADLVPDAQNPNLGTERGREMVEHSLSHYGAGRSVLVDRRGRIIAGNKTTEAAAGIGMEDVTVVQTDGSKLVVVQRTDLDLEEDLAARALSVADNRASEVGLQWDARLLDQLMSQAPEEIGALFSDREIAALLRQDESDRDQTEEVEGSATNVAADLLRDQWGTEVGQVWEAPSLKTVGKVHRLICADSREPETMRRLFGAARARCVWTDPPWGVDYADAQEFRQEMNPAARITEPITGDGMDGAQIAELIVRALSSLVPYSLPAAAIYVAAPSGPMIVSFIVGMNRSGFKHRQTLAWVKNQQVFGRSDYHYRHEHVLYGWLEGGAHLFAPVSASSSVFEIDKPQASTLHPTEKPVELVRPMIINSTRLGEVVADPFLGSGTTAVAAEQAGRVCYGAEVEPKYLAVTLQRLADLGLEPRRVEPA